eukprot:1179379-Prorocentrum_minimum.AAC.2
MDSLGRLEQECQVSLSKIDAADNVDLTQIIQVDLSHHTAAIARHLISLAETANGCRKARSSLPDQRHTWYTHSLHIHSFQVVSLGSGRCRSTRSTLISNSGGNPSWSGKWYAADFPQTAHPAKIPAPVYRKALQQRSGTALQYITALLRQHLTWRDGVQQPSVRPYLYAYSRGGRVQRGHQSRPSGNQVQKTRVRPVPLSISPMPASDIPTHRPYPPSLPTITICYWRTLLYRLPANAHVASLDLTGGVNRTDGGVDLTGGVNLTGNGVDLTGGVNLTGDGVDLTGAQGER